MNGEEGRFKGKVTLVTGGASGIGQAIAKGFANQDSMVAILDILEEEGGNTAKEIELQGGKAMAMKVDATDRQQVKSSVKEIINEWGRIDILVNNIGFAMTIPFLETDEAHWHRMLGINLIVPLRFCHLVLPYMLKQQYGRIVNISSIAGRQPRPEGVIYSAAKAGVISMTRSLAVAMAPHNIRVNCVSPGTIETALARQLRHDRPEYVEDLMTKKVALGRFGQPEEVAAVVLFLASDESSYMVGQSVSVDGGNNML